MAFKKNIDVIFEISTKFGVVLVLMLSKQYRFCISGVVCWTKCVIFVHFRENLGIFADLDVDGRACRVLLGEFKGEKGELMFR